MALLVLASFVGACGGSSTSSPPTESTGTGGSPAVGAGGQVTSTGGGGSVTNTGGGGVISGTGGSSAGPDASTTGAGGGSPGCTAGTTMCGTTCHNLMSEIANCGACAHACPTGQACTAGVCGCAAGQVMCNGVCVATASDPKNCGACGTACATGMVCSAGKCSTGCGTGLSLCGNSCVDLTGSAGNCGSCGKACPTDQSCYMGACRCATGLGPCGTNGQCVDILSSEQNCGTCGLACATGQTCNAGVCACPGAQQVCSGACKDLAADPVNCGTCGTKCGTGTQCLFGGCIDPTSVNCGGGAKVGMSCTRDAFVTEGKYWVNNNWWGISASNPIPGMQCIWGTCQTGDLVGWGTSWTWNGAGGVKTFSSLVMGWQFGLKIPNSGLPVQISANHAINCGWSFAVTGTGTIDVSYDTWMHTIPAPGFADAPVEEVMIWLYESGGAAPIGPVVAANVSLAGTTWDLHEGQGGSTWRVASFVRRTTATTAVMNMAEFYNYLAAPPAPQQPYIQKAWYLTSIQTGTEVFNGTGELDTNGFYCRVQ
jgi:hypothetical protein